MRGYKPRPETVLAFTAGDCWLLAYVMARMTGKPMVFANPDPKWTDYWEHVGLQISDNRILDIQGVHTNKAWREKWAGKRGVIYRTGDPDRVFELIGDQDGPEFPSTRPHRPARRLLDTYAPHLLG